MEAVEAVERPERFLVRKVGKEFLVAAREIEWLEAAENYVNLDFLGRSNRSIPATPSCC